MKKFEQFHIRTVAGGYATIPANPKRHPLLSKLHHGAAVDRCLATELPDLVRRIRSVGQKEGMTVVVCGALATQPTVLLRQRTPDQRSPKPRKGWINNLADVATRLYDIDLDQTNGKALDERKDADAKTIAERVSHRVYKYTDCGAWLALMHGTQWDPKTGHRPARHPNRQLVGITLGSIVEGIDATTDTHDLRFPFTEKSFWAALQAVEDEASELWKGSHGCETCAKHWQEEGFATDEWGDEFEGDDGHTPVWDECPDCGGSGAII